MDASTKRSIAIFAVATIVGSLLIGIAAVSSRSQSSISGTQPACDEHRGTIVEVQDFTAYDEQRGKLPDTLLRPASVDEDDQGYDTTVPPSVSIDRIDGKSRQWAYSTGDGSSYQFFSTNPLPFNSSLWEFQAQGGIQLQFTPTRAAALSIADFRESLGPRATPVLIGRSEGIVVWADPDNPSGQRLHHAYWEDDEGLWSLQADMSAAQIVSSARIIACR